MSAGERPDEAPVPPRTALTEDMNELWAFAGNRISVRFEHESREAEGRWWRSHGSEHWELDERGYMRRRDASINDVPIEEAERRYRT